MRTSKKLLLRFLPIFLSLMTIALAACGGGSGTNSSAKASDDKQILRYPVVGDVATLDPALVEDTDSNFPIQAIYTGLVTLDAKLNVQKQLASNIAVSADGLTYTFTLKPNLTFSDGSPLTAQDVIYSINRTVEPATKSDVSYYLSLLKDYDQIAAGKIPTLIGDSLLAPDNSTVVIKIKEPAAYFLEALSYPTSYVVNKKLIDKYGTKFTDHLGEGAGDGPFEVASYSHTKGIELVPNPKYYGDQPQLKHLSIVFYADQDGMFRAYQAKQLDFTPVPANNIATQKSKPGFSETDLLSISYFSMNYLAKPFDDIKIRQAFALALNKDIIVETAEKNAFTPSNHIIPSGMLGYDQALTGPDGTSTKGDPTKAKQLLQEGMQEAGYTTLPPITLTYYARDQGFTNAMNEAKQQWSDNLGVNVTINSVGRAELLSLETATKNNTGPLQMWQANWNADYPDPQDWLTTFFDKGSDYNQFNYGQNHTSVATAEQAIQVQLEKADGTANASQRVQLYNDAEQKIINDVGWLPLWQRKYQTMTGTNVHGLAIDPQLSVPPDDWHNVYMTQ